MEMNNIVRHILYCDKETVNSDYAQILSNIEEITLTNGRSSKISGSAGLEYAFDKIFGTNISGEYSNESSTKQSVKVGITLEDKITSILNHIGPGDSRKIDTWPDEPRLVVGYAILINEEEFKYKVDDKIKSNNEEYKDYNSYESFIRDIRHKPDFESRWLRFRYFVSRECRFSRKGLFNLPSYDRLSIPTIIKDIAINLRYPVTLIYSSNKLRISGSQTIFIGLSEKIPKIGILGVMQKNKQNEYSIKPLVMWQDVNFGPYIDNFKRSLRKQSH